MATKSPFLIKQEFLSPLLCEDLVDNLNLTIPDEDLEGYPTKTIRMNEKNDEIIFNRLELIFEEIEQYYEIEYEGTEQMTFEWYAEECKGTPPHCESSTYVNQKWVRSKNRDLTGVVFLSDYQEQVPFDSDFECYGGKLEFAQHHFGFNPQRGTLILFPSDPHFINNTTEILVGDLFQVRFHIAAKEPFLYDPKKFLGNYQIWLSEFA
jgi:hypothetical protein